MTRVLLKRIAYDTGVKSPVCAQIATRKSQRIDGRPRPRSGRRTGVAPLGRRRRASTRMCERLDRTKNTLIADAQL
jgi:hypothetical protein